MPRHRSLLISTGGTIAGEVARAPGEAARLTRPEALSDALSDAVAAHETERGLRVSVEAEAYLQVDSSDIKPEHWVGLVDRIEAAYDDYDSFLITHGTNTMGYTCAALSFAFVNSGKPIVVTGSQVPLHQPGSDAKSNLDNALRLATTPETSGVVCVFGSHVIAGTRVKKYTDFDYDAIRPFRTGSLGRIGRILDLDPAALARHRAYLDTAATPIARARAGLRTENAFAADLVSLTEFPGMDYELLLRLHEDEGVRGFLIRAFGAGDLSRESQPVLRRLKERGVPVVVTSQAPNGTASLQVNAPGQQLAEEELVIPAFDMSLEAQTAKLMWLLAKKDQGKLGYRELRERMLADLRGEIRIDDARAREAAPTGA